jgi:hypothetical protein
MLKVANSVISASRITGVLPVLNGGTGVSTSTGTGNTVLSASPTLSGDVAMSTGNLVISTAGKGIDFSATSGTGTSELLADYEEGTWTPTFVSTTGSNPTVTYGNQYGYYVKVGRMVHINMYLTASAITGGTGWLTVGGLPFSTDNSTANYGAIAVAGVNNIPMAGGETQYGLRVNPGGSTMLFLILKANTAENIVDLTGVSQGGVTAGGTYISAS